MKNVIKAWDETLGKPFAAMERVARGIEKPINESSGTVQVYLLKDNGEIAVWGYCGISPREALIAMFAQAVMGDYNTWQYSQRYGHLVKKALHGMTCGNCWTAYANK